VNLQQQTLLYHSQPANFSTVLYTSATTFILLNNQPVLRQQQPVALQNKPLIHAATEACSVPSRTFWFMLQTDAIFEPTAASTTAQAASTADIRAEYRATSV
jgi:hypothetical protein